MNRLTCILALLAGTGLTGCGSSRSTDVARPTGSSDVSPAAFSLEKEPPGAKAVTEVKKSMSDNDVVVVVGRVGGSTEPIVKNRLAFTIVDTALKPCNEKGDDACETPWDYCCDPREEVVKATLFVRFVDQAGKTLQSDATELLGIKPLSTVVIQGRTKRDPDGNVAVVADKLFIRSK